MKFNVGQKENCYIHPSHNKAHQETEEKEQKQFQHITGSVHRKITAGLNNKLAYVSPGR
jgi:hypothetical protein